eukprot:TRINITY_DN25487_c0_g1_i1.p1 TRINITY_DN25487_c0_g1~~TRINITY_DN25487_c0_g1_i1.p1  ORF type:complete len:105 (+),score=13.81 TRINITY_DN25487_c0_g1_i1:113-427(+)
MTRGGYLYNTLSDFANFEKDISAALALPKRDHESNDIFASLYYLHNNNMPDAEEDYQSCMTVPQISDHLVKDRQMRCLKGLLPIYLMNPDRTHDLLHNQTDIGY